MTEIGVGKVIKGWDEGTLSSSHLHSRLELELIIDADAIRRATAITRPESRPHSQLRLRASLSDSYPARQRP